MYYYYFLKKKKTASGYHYKERKGIQLTVQTVQGLDDVMAFLLAEYCGFTEHHPETGSLCVCVFWYVLHTVPVFNQGHDYLSNSISEDLENLILQSDKDPILIISPSRATRRSPWKIQSKRTNQNRQKVYKKRGKKEIEHH